MTVDRLENEALSLPDAARERLAHLLIASLDDEAGADPAGGPTAWLDDDEPTRTDDDHAVDDLTYAWVQAFEGRARSGG